MPIPESADKIARPLARESVYTTLQNWIMDGTLQPGETIKDQELASRLGVSRTPIREALRRLEDEGLVQTALNRWTRVAPLDAAEVDKLYPIVFTLEALALSLCDGKITDAHLAHLLELNNLLLERAQKRDVVGSVSADYVFHEALIKPCGNDELLRILEGVKVKLRRMEIGVFSNPTNAQSSVQDHQNILDALSERDLAYAEALLRDHWKASLGRWQLSRQLTSDE